MNRIVALLLLVNSFSLCAQAPAASRLVAYIKFLKHANLPSEAVTIQAPLTQYITKITHTFSFDHHHYYQANLTIYVKDLILSSNPTIKPNSDSMHVKYFLSRIASDKTLYDSQSTSVPLQWDQLYRASERNPGQIVDDIDLEIKIFKKTNETI